MVPFMIPNEDPKSHLRPKIARENSNIIQLSMLIITHKCKESARKFKIASLSNYTLIKLSVLLLESEPKFEFPAIFQLLPEGTSNAWWRFLANPI